MATAVFVGSAGMLGFFAHLFTFIPQAAVLPILIFIGLEITSQSFHATPTRHYPAVAFACLPAMAYLMSIFTDSLLAQAGLSIDKLAPPLNAQLQTIRCLAGGFIVTSLLWASALAATIDRRMAIAAGYWGLAAVASLFGVIHSPLPGNPLVLPWRVDELPQAAAGQTPFYFGAAYSLIGILMLAWGKWRSDESSTVTSDAH